MKYQYNDGGRKEAGFSGRTGDCITRAIAIATGIPYKEVYDSLFMAGKKYEISHRSKVAKRMKSAKSGSLHDASPRYGVYREIYHPYLISLGWEWVPCMKIGSGCKVHLKEDELPSGRIIVSLSRHYAAVVDGVLNDTYDHSDIRSESGMEDGKPFNRSWYRCVYGYWRKKNA